MKIIKQPNFKSFLAAIIKLILSVLALVFFLNSVSAQTKDTLIKVADNIFEIRGFIGNVVFLVTDDGVCLIDAGASESDGEKIIKHIQSVTNKTIEYVIVTHHHFDHIGGLSALPKTAKIIAQSNIIEHLQEAEKQRNIEINITLPSIIDSLQLLEKNIKVKEGRKFEIIDSLLQSSINQLNKLSKEKTVYPKLLIDSLNTMILGKDTIDIIHPGQAHTNCDLVISLKTRKIMVMGDLLFNKCWLYVDSSGSVGNWSQQLKILANYNVKYFIPGHAELANKDDMLLFSNYLNDLSTKVKSLKDQNKSVEEIKTLVSLPDYDEYGFKNSRNHNIEIIYKQLK